MKKHIKIRHLLTIPLTTLIFGGCNTTSQTPTTNISDNSLRDPFPITQQEMEHRRIGKLGGDDMILWSNNPQKKSLADHINKKIYNNENAIKGTNNAPSAHGTESTNESEGSAQIKEMAANQQPTSQTQKLPHQTTPPQQTKAQTQPIGGADPTTQQLVPATPNPYLWKAAILTIASMPIASIDPSSGFISTDWYQDGNNLDVRHKVNITIANSKLNPHAVTVNAFVEQKSSDGKWHSKGASHDMAAEIQHKIIAEAYKLRFNKKEK